MFINFSSSIFVNQIFNNYEYICIIFPSWLGLTASEKHMQERDSLACTEVIDNFWWINLNDFLIDKKSI